MRIVVDYRERSSGLIEVLKRQADVHVAALRVGDYLLNGRLIVERKTARDFAVSIIDQRLFTQAARLRASRSRSVLLIEGDPFRNESDIHESAVRGAILSLQGIWQLPVLYSRSKDETAQMLVHLASLEETCSDVVPLRCGYRPRKLKTRQLYLLQGLPRVGRVLAVRLLDRFGTPATVFNASIEELTQVKGVGKVNAERIRQVLDSQ